MMTTNRAQDSKQGSAAQPTITNPRRWYDKQYPMVRFLQTMYGFDTAVQDTLGKHLCVFTKDKYAAYADFGKKKAGGEDIHKVLALHKAENRLRRYDRIQGLHETMGTHYILPTSKQNTLSSECFVASSSVEEYILECAKAEAAVELKLIDELMYVYRAEGVMKCRQLLKDTLQALKPKGPIYLIDGTKLGTLPSLMQAETSKTTAESMEEEDSFIYIPKLQKMS
jgi:hypothetical protein